ncbi:hypothetical protein BgiBS90_030601 [Biomphalaria glabrata]|nr:hypothetical protein BgiBS90_030601 [Biomphalaria glabrata]
MVKLRAENTTVGVKVTIRTQATTTTVLTAILSLTAKALAWSLDAWAPPLHRESLFNWTMSTVVMTTMAGKEVNIMTVYTRKLIPSRSSLSSRGRSPRRVLLCCGK